MSDFVDKILIALPNYLSDVLGMFSGPKRFLGSIQLSGVEAVTRAAIFLGLTFLICFASQLPFIEKWRSAPSSIFFSQLSMAAIFFLVELVILQWSWRAVGGKAEFKQSAVFLAYMDGSAMLLMWPFILIGTAIAYRIDPAAFARALVPGMVDGTNILSPMAFYALSFFLALGLIAASIWGIISWGAFRQINGVSKLRSVIAYIINTIVIIPITLLSIFIGT